MSTGIGTQECVCEWLHVNGGIGVNHGGQEDWASRWGVAAPGGGGESLRLIALRGRVGGVG